MRLIDADALIERTEALDKFFVVNWTSKKVQALINHALTVDAAPVKHGQWISLTECANAGVYCSVCNKKVYKEDYAWCNKRNKMRSNYCPNCGAKMDEADDNDIN